MTKEERRDRLDWASLTPERIEEIIAEAEYEAAVKASEEEREACAKEIEVLAGLAQSDELYRGAEIIRERK